MRKISMFLICSTLLAVPAFATSEPATASCTGTEMLTVGDDNVQCAQKKGTTEIARQLDECTGDDVSPYVNKTHAEKYIWVNNSNSGTHACISPRGGYVRCACGIYECEPGWQPDRRTGLKCIEWPEDPRLRNGGRFPMPADGQAVDEEGTEAPQECEGGNQTIGGQTYTCAKDAENNIIVVGRQEEPCRENFGVTIANTKTCKWQNAAAEDTTNVFACKNDENFVRCVYRITECVNDNFESRDGGLTCQEKADGQTVVAPGTQPVDTKSIATLAGRLAKVENQFGLSKWRTADGEFNKARLASDLTAGVVLGTTGALVTASVVKKKQVKDGFESLECTIGGQHVGDYGDTFHIFGK